MKVESTSVWSAMKRSTEGMKVSGVGMATAATDIVSTTKTVLNDSPLGSPAVIDARVPPDLQDSMMELKRHSYGHLANGRAMKCADMALESLFDVLHPARKEQD